MIKIKHNNQENFERSEFLGNNNLVITAPTTPTRVSFAAWRPDKKTQLGDFAEMSEKLVV